MMHAVPGSEPLDLATPRKVHIVGVGGAGMSAIAVVLHTMGHRVTGSDLKPSVAFDRLAALGLDVRVGHHADHLGDADLVVVSTAVPAHNPEVRAATERGVPVLRRAAMLAAITRVRPTIAVAGTHGKTTTSSMLALCLLESGLRPSFVIGGDLNEIGTGAAWDEGDRFVVEADESDGTFVELARSISVVTNVEPDHLDFFGTVEAMEAAFDTFVTGTTGPAVVCADDRGAAALAARHRGREGGLLTYGTAPDADYRMVDLTRDGLGSRFDLEHRGARLGTVTLAVPGIHNARNATAALVAALAAGAPFDLAVHGLARFTGVARRFEFRGDVDGVTFVDDYAHLPTEVAATLDAATGGGWRRIVCVFQPHRYSRTAALASEFGAVFGAADVLAVTDVYGAGETPLPGVSGKLVVDAVLDADPWARVAYLPRREDVLTFLQRELRPGDLCLTLGAGDLTSLPDELGPALARARGASEPQTVPTA
jgi:UDP-N-acetylmuramate--alanine ligase